jgi:hypothetical protein
MCLDVTNSACGLLGLARHAAHEDCRSEMPDTLSVYRHLRLGSQCWAEIGTPYAAVSIERGKGLPWNRNFFEI